MFKYKTTGFVNLKITLRELNIRVEGWKRKAGVTHLQISLQASNFKLLG